ncbi:exonuclease SbcCD subunit D [Nocardioides sp. R-C-SC26]|uniref:exonuclease SbcCD subunit D n=1 Tax=Nocardioides sp. R-C-SC26 TaxID=2870414 RepID=UPI001E3A52A8|nr:exonuclease SbcCD subunit D [Nocardioides sp. R-C-SC26]
MRILHTSDWHLGRSFHREGMLTHQAAYLDHLVEVIDGEEVDLVVVAGDVYDRALPPVDAVTLAGETLERLAASRARVVVTSGNHDSARRLGFGSRLIDAAGVHLRTDPAGVGAPVLLEDAHGAVAVYGIPFLDPHAVSSAWALEAASHQTALGEAMRRIRADLAQRAGARSVVLAHAFVAGAAPSDSERDISVGGVARVPVSLFDGVDYAALGHLHGAHVLSDQVRYSGSPLAYSFSEAGHRKGSWLIDLAADGVRASEFVPAPVPRPLARLHGSLDELLGDPSLDEHEASWVEATLTDVPRPAHAMDRLRRRFPHTLVLGFDAVATPFDVRAVADHGRDDRAVAADFVLQVRGVPATSEELALLGEAVDACCDDTSTDAEPAVVGGAVP